MYKPLFIYFLFTVLIFSSFNSYSQSFEEITELAGLRTNEGSEGVNFIDIDGDGFDDLYFVSRYGENKLFLNKGNFRFEEKGKEFGLNHGFDSKNSLWFDYDNDGDQDLFLGTLTGNHLFYVNEGNEFVEKSVALGIRSKGNIQSIAVADVDNDGFLDVYISLFGAENLLFKNQEGNSFLNIISSSGISDPGPSMGAIFFDYDNDGDQDLYQVRDAKLPNLLFRNNGLGHFEEVGKQAMVNYAGFGMGVDVGDLNNDGFLDLYVTNLHENLLYINDKDGTFSEIAKSSGVDDIGMGWGTFVTDINNDGLEDIYVANESDFGINGVDNFKNLLYLNKGNLIFEPLGYEGGIQNLYSSYGAAYGDLDNDGKLDIAVANLGEPGNQIFKNTSENESFLALNIKGKKSNANGIGTRIKVYSQSQIIHREKRASGGWVSQNTKYIHFGLGTQESIDSVVVDWPSGIHQVIENPIINQYHTIVEKEESTNGPLVWTDPPFPTQFDDITLYFDAREGNGGLEGYEGDVYAHIGVITSNSTSNTDWKYVVGTWGTDVPETKMTREEQNVYSLSFNIQDFFGIPEGESVEQIAMVFRSLNGNVTGRDVGGGDIYTPVYPPEDGLFISITSPDELGEFVKENDTLKIIATTNKKSKLDLIDNGEVIFSDSITDFMYDYASDVIGVHTLEFVFSLDGDSIKNNRTIYVLDLDIERIDAPEGLKNGVNYYTDSSLIFKLYAPNKEFVFFLTYENNFSPSAEYRMRQSIDGDYFWIELPKNIFIPEVSNAYTYLVELNLIADPFSTLILDPFNDFWVPDDVMAELPPYPEELPGVQISVLDVEPLHYEWTATEYDRPDKRNLVIYEVLMRDFLEDRNYKSLIDTLDYIERLGVNAIELMPVNEFEGNDSWGYNPSFHMALDKYYGSRDQFKAFIDEAHKRGIAVILDVVYNHVFSTSPLARLYWDPINFRPTPENPYLNVVAKHPFNVGYDVNHESEATKEWVKQTLKYWIEEYNVDGFRFDLSKGFTQFDSGNNVELMGRYDASRVAILKDYSDFIWSLDPESYITFEHFGDDREEQELANYGMMLWNNLGHQYTEAARGRSSNLERTDYKERGWNVANQIVFMESHDEERVMYQLSRSGASEGEYDVTDPETSLQRVAAAATILYSVPGPRLLWQFGELGYDYSIGWCTNGLVQGCRLDPKPVRWDYLQELNRKKLHDVISNLIHLRTNYPTFSTEDYEFDDGNFYLKYVRHNHPDMNAVTMVNFRVTNSDLNPKFQHPGIWYEYFTGDSLIVEDTQEKLTFLPGEYRIYTSKRITPPNGFITSVKDYNLSSAQVYPNPIAEDEHIFMVLENEFNLEKLWITDGIGRKVTCAFQQFGREVQIEIPLNLTSGYYFIEAWGREGKVVEPFVKQD